MSEILVEWHDGTALLTINRPERRNALGSPQLDELADCLEQASRQDALRALVITGAGEFCAGGDLKVLNAVAERQEASPSTYDAAHRMIRTLMAVPVPTIAAVDGAAVGMGMDLALACDSRFIGTTGWMRQGWARYGAIPATGGLVFLERLAPGIIWRLLDGQPKLDGPGAAAIGLGEAVAGSASEAALARARNYATIPVEALRAYVRLLRAPIVTALEDCFPTYARVQAALFNEGTFGALVAQALEQQSAGRSDHPTSRWI